MKKTALLLSGALISLGLPQMAFAADASEQANSAGDSAGTSADSAEIVVTAGRITETLREVPIAVSVQSQDDLSKAGATNIQTLGSTVPNLQIATQGFNGATLISLRGVSNSDPNAQGNPAVATYIDGIYVGQTSGLVGAFYDLDRVEVLRGPQGTLYGRNSTGGNVNIFTADPQKDFHASGDLSFGNYNDVQARATINVPISDTLAVRVAGVVHRNDGYVNTNGVTARNYAKADDFGGRITALWQPSDKFSWRVSADSFQTNGTPTLVLQVDANGNVINPGGYYNPVISGFPEPINDNSNLMVRSKMEYNFSDDLTLSYLAGYQKTSRRIQFGWYGDSGVTNSTGLNLGNFHSLSNEMTLTYKKGPITNIIGGSIYSSDIVAPAVYGIVANDFLFGVEDGGGYSTNAKGIFDQLTYEIKPGLRVIAGLRYSVEKAYQINSDFVFCTPVASFIGTNYSNLINNLPTVAATPLPGGFCFSAPVGEGNGTWKNLSWKGGLTFDLSDNVSGYVTATSGFKSGGFNLGVPAYRPEKIVNYEAGLKFRALDGRLNVSTAAFVEDYTDLQVYQQVVGGPGTITTQIVNAAAAQVKGAEVEASFQFTDNDRIGGYVTYLDARYKNYTNAPDPLDGTLFANLDGNRLPSAPKWSARITYAHEFDLANGGTLTPTIGTYWKSEIFLRQFNRPIDRVGGFTKTDFDLTYVSPDEHWSISAYVHNLENKARRNSAYVDIGIYNSDVNPPRTFGVRVGVKY